MGSKQSVQPVLLEKVQQLIDTKLDDGAQAIVTKLAHHLLGNISLDDLANRTESDLYGAIVSVWHHLNESNATSQSIKVFNPQVSKHGWQSSHTIIEIVLPDTPFLVDSIKMVLARFDLATHIMLHGPARIKWQDQSISDIACDNGTLMSMFHIEIDRINDKAKINELKDELMSVLSDTALVVKDWQPMVDKLNTVIKQLEKQKKVIPIESDRFVENLEFLRWLVNHNFTFMGYKEYNLVDVKGDIELQPTQETGLGIFTDKKRVRSVKLSQFSESARNEATKPFIVILTKGNTQCRIHRPAYTDYIGIKKFDSKGNVIGEHRFTGLYTSAVYNQTVESIPLIREKVERILMASGYFNGSYAYKALHNILENYPRDELLQAKEEELLQVGKGVVQMQDRDLLRVFVRRDPFGRFFSCMVYVTKDRHTTELRKKTQLILADYFGSKQKVEYSVFFSESSLARTHYIVRVDSNIMDVDVKQIEQNLTEASTSWDDRLSDAIVVELGESKGLPLSKEYMSAFPRSYKEAMLPSSAVADIEALEKLSEDSKLGMLFYRPQEESSSSKVVRLKIYYRDEPIHLSDVMPLLENMGLRVIGEAPYEVIKSNGQIYWILDFSMLSSSNSPIDIRESRDRFQNAFADIWYGRIENDGFNSLILNTKMSAREVAILRAYARYMRQVGFPFSQQYIEITLNHYPHIASLLVTLFINRFEPRGKPSSDKQQKIIDQITQHLEDVESLDDDRIIRRYMEMMVATIRTNYFQKDELGKDKPWISFKMNPKKIPEIPAPVPAYEIFVYSPDVEGVHLRGGKVARGGLRWSDRYEDFRTEILGLVKAQQVKNTVIVPVGAKGGFVCKKQSLLSGRDEIFAEGQRCYKIFIRGLLDVTDNIVNGEIQPPSQVIRYDDDDPYLVVAADKGTATFSDLANSVSREYHFWLDDAFASGGSNGYDHKAMGITAKGAWESVKRHFREVNIDCQTTDFTVVGIGDMAGDVFGNGMLLSKHIQLVAAFNHMNIFIDPNPDSSSSWVERERLFNLPRSSWEDYDKSLISKGGGIFSRKVKSISLTPEMKVMLETSKSQVTPNELIHLLLTMNVDLLWNGGIGTYIKSSKESNADVGDRTNDALRVNGSEVKAKIVGEGGNLGVTQLGRVEYALSGGRINTDFVDNVGGVDCSDNEVNIKIFLNSLVHNGDLTLKNRNELLVKMQDEVGSIVLSDAYQQSESISVTESQGTSVVKQQIRFIHSLEKLGFLDRNLEFLPDDETLFEREKRGEGLTRPELSVLVAYGKMLLKQQLASERVASEPFHSKLLQSSFPTELQRNFNRELESHPLRTEIIATTLANQIVNEMGCNFVSRLQEETGSDVIDITNAYTVVREVFGLGEVIDTIRTSDLTATAQSQYSLLIHLRRMLRRLTRWILRNQNAHQPIEALIDRYSDYVKTIFSQMDDLLVSSEVEEHLMLASRWIESGIDEKTAHYVSRLSSLTSALDIIEVAYEHESDIVKTARLYYHLGDRLSLHWFLNQINHQAIDNNWQALARAAFREDLDWQQRSLTSKVMNCASLDKEHAELEVLESWISENKKALLRWDNILNEFKVGSVHEFAKFSVALRELALLNLNCTTNQ
ncbi:NAD-glutamate dehydrogenase [Vibrio viridaestus]|uniref:NAD-glutamate dehydrogenase n=1 Tax=Vibrio viridaestus TaxID=2487322 RepID=A0A3N9TH82_9VIBR|nr:NAD-glutamate dehydrogenase [Vibrio viridaestus]RQW63559.1 NAD-glutamate dehydrogenase [Vibrio viridaestus]